MILVRRHAIYKGRARRDLAECDLVKLTPIELIIDHEYCEIIIGWYPMFEAGDSVTIKIEIERHNK